MTVEGFAERLRRAMDAAGMDQRTLARSLRVREATVSDWFGKGILPRLDVMARVPGVLRVDGHWLLTGEGDMHRRERSAKEAAYDAMADVVRAIEEDRPGDIDRMRSWWSSFRREHAAGDGPQPEADDPLP